MNHHYSHLNTAETILSGYLGEEPFANYLRKFFASNKKYGSKDRKSIAQLCFCYFRMGRLLQNVDIRQRIISGLFLCSGPNEILATLSPELNERAANDLSDKLDHLGAKAEQVFPCIDQLSDEIEMKRFSLSHFTQPDLFLRIRPGKREAVLRKLSSSHIPHCSVEEDILALPQSTKIEEVLQSDREVVIQDISSQRVGKFFIETIEKFAGHKKIIDVWDVCAASGGKSIMMSDLLSDIRLTVSDVRDSILINLRKRFANAGIKDFKSLTLDATKQVEVERKLKGKKFDLVIADVPCSGSGTWGRTPENLLHFDCERIDHYASLQSAILRSIATSVKKGGLILYITCSVYEKENEKQMKLLASLGFEILGSQLLAGWEERGDSMWVVVGRC